MWTVRDATPQDAAGMLEIYAPIVRETSISFELEPPAAEAFAARVAAALERHAWVVAARRDGRLLGYAYAGPWRSRPAYRWSVEVAIYVRDGARGKGLGRSLYRILFERLRSRGYVTAVAGITLPNPGSVAFHEACGFRSAGVVPRAGYKHARWSDVGFWHASLREPEDPPREPL